MVVPDPEGGDESATVGASVLFLRGVEGDSRKSVTFCIKVSFVSVRRVRRSGQT